MTRNIIRYLAIVLLAAALGFGLVAGLDPEPPIDGPVSEKVGGGQFQLVGEWHVPNVEFREVDSPRFDLLARAVEGGGQFRASSA